MKSTQHTKTVVTGFALVFTCLLFIPGVSAQEAADNLLTLPKPRQGYYLGLGAVGGAAGFHHYKEGWIPVFGGGGAAVHVGQGLNDQIALGLDIGVVGGGNADRDLLMGHIALELKWNLFDKWFVRPSVGFGFADFYRRSDNVKKVLGTISGSYTLCAGYDFVLAKKQYGSGGYTLSPHVWINGANGINLHSISGGIGVEITRWSGLDKNQLVLPTEQAF